MTELPKPAKLAARGGVWFSSGAVQLHLGVDRDFHPARKAHPALRTRAFEPLQARLRAANIAFVTDDNLPGASRFYVDDIFGNRLEIMAE
jgi:hypothetical protein